MTDAVHVRVHVEPSPEPFLLIAVRFYMKLNVYII